MGVFIYLLVHTIIFLLIMDTKSKCKWSQGDAMKRASIYEVNKMTRALMFLQETYHKSLKIRESKSNIRDQKSV